MRSFLAAESVIGLEVKHVGNNLIYAFNNCISLWISNGCNDFLNSIRGKHFLKLHTHKLCPIVMDALKSSRLFAKPLFLKCNCNGYSPFVRESTNHDVARSIIVRANRVTGTSLSVVLKLYGPIRSTHT